MSYLYFRYQMPFWSVLSHLGFSELPHNLEGGIAITPSGEFATHVGLPPSKGISSKSCVCLSHPTDSRLGELYLVDISRSEWKFLFSICLGQGFGVGEFSQVWQAVELRVVL